MGDLEITQYRNTLAVSVASNTWSVLCLCIHISEHTKLKLSCISNATPTFSILLLCHSATFYDWRITVGEFFHPSPQASLSTTHSQLILCPFSRLLRHAGSWWEYSSAPSYRAIQHSLSALLVASYDTQAHSGRILLHTTIIQCTLLSMLHCQHQSNVPLPLTTQSMLVDKFRASHANCETVCAAINHFSIQMLEHLSSFS